MKLLLYSYPYAPRVGGLERLTARTAHLLAARGLEVTVVTDTEDAAGASAPRPPPPFRLYRRPPLRVLAKLIRDCDVVQLNSFDGAVFALARLMSRPVVWQHIDYHTICPRGVCVRSGQPCSYAVRRCWSCLRSDHNRTDALHVLLAFGAKVMAARLVARNLVVSRYTARRLRLRRQTVLPLGVDITTFRDDANATPPAPRFTVLFSGRHIAGKGCDVLVRALAVCRDRDVPVHATIVGDGPHRAESRRLAAELHLHDRLDFVGFVSDRDLVDMIRAAHAVVVPPLIDEYFGLTAAEALSCGRPVIAADIGSLPEVIGDAGLLFRAGDHEDLARQICRLASDDGLRRDLAARGRARAVAVLSDEALVDGYIAVHGEVSRGRRGCVVAEQR